MGRFGNTLFEISFLLGYCKKYGFLPEIPMSWSGFKIFDVDIPYLNSVLPTYSFDQIPDGLNNININGYYQFQEALDFYTIEDIKQWFPIKKIWLDRFNKKESYIAIHNRRGDYVSQPTRYCSISDSSFRNIIDHVKQKYTVDEIVILTEENPIIDYECESLGIGFLPDFMKMVFSDVLIRSNSTMSWWASVFQRIYNPIGITYAPLVEDKVGWSDVDFVCGNWPRLIHEKNFDPWTRHSDLFIKDR